MNDPSDIVKNASLQSSLNYHIYENITTLCKQLSENMTYDEAVAMICNTLSTNLGIFLTQIPENTRTDCVNQCIKTMESSLISVTETMDTHHWGHIGHA